jgi:hypothetical protein
MLTIAKTLLILDGWTQDAVGRAIDAPDAFGCVKAHQRAELLRGMADSVRRALAEGSAPFLVAPKVKARAKAKAAPKPTFMDPFAFWTMHHAAVDKIRAVYGDFWSVRAPLGETELVAVDAKLRPSRKSGAFIVSYPRDNRFPAAKYWPAGEYPHGVVGQGDYARHQCQPRDVYADTRRRFVAVVTGRRLFHEKGSDGWIKCTEGARGILAELRGMVRAAPIVITPVSHDADWHKARGYAWNGSDWVFALGLDASRAQAEGVILEREFKRVAALEAACLSYGPQPRSAGFVDIEDDIELAA